MIVERRLLLWQKWLRKAKEIVNSKRGDPEGGEK